MTEGGSRLETRIEKSKTPSMVSAGRTVDKAQQREYPGSVSRSPNAQPRRRANGGDFLLGYPLGE